MGIECGLWSSCELPKLDDRKNFVFSYKILFNLHCLRFDGGFLPPHIGTVHRVLGLCCVYIGCAMPFFVLLCVCSVLCTRCAAVAASYHLNAWMFALNNRLWWHSIANKQQLQLRSFSFSSSSSFCLFEKATRQAIISKERGKMKRKKEMKNTQHNSQINKNLCMCLSLNNSQITTIKMQGEKKIPQKPEKVWAKSTKMN